MNGIEKLHELFEEAQRRIIGRSNLRTRENHRKWLAYCLGIMSGKMDKTDFDTMREGIKKYED